MNGWMDKFRAWSARMMAGRYGADQLNLAIIMGALAVTLAGSLTGVRLIVLAADALLILAFYRMLSRDRVRRAQENAKYLQKTAAPRKAVYEWMNRRRNSKQYRYYVCPKCHERLRVPRGVGQVTITCRKCGERFDRKA